MYVPKSFDNIFRYFYDFDEFHDLIYHFIIGTYILVNIYIYVYRYTKSINVKIINKQLVYSLNIYR